ncbi:glycosyl transferase [Bacteroidia bacterium]|nr:glycosyl transferase [Bacteroidia bacterium]
MDNYFNINLEFDREKVKNSVHNAIESGVAEYICSVDGNNLALANKNPAHLEVLNGSMFNVCDSAWIPLFVNWIYKTNYGNYTGPDLFLEYVKLKQYRQFFLGSNPEILEKLKKQLTGIDPAIAGMKFEALPYREVENFDYLHIAQRINEENPDIVWVSLGAPKQEQFMCRLKPFLKRGVMFGVGAAFKFYSGISEYKRAPHWMIRLKLEWLFRTFQEPKRMVKRYWNVFVSFPGLIVKELKKKQ